MCSTIRVHIAGNSENLANGTSRTQAHILSMHILDANVMAGETQGSLRRGVFATVINNLRAPGGLQHTQVVQSSQATIVSWDHCTFA